MERDLASSIDGIPERYVPELMRGQLLEAEHVVRYAWVAGAVGGKRVLDAGCGTAYGTALLARAGAAEVVGVDIAESVLEAARPGMPDGVSLVVGDLRSLPLALEASFDVVVCFEVIEHFEHPRAVLDELARVIAPGGVLIVSSPNRAASTEDNPHHHHEFEVEELSDALAERFENVRMYHQQVHVTTAILDDDARAVGDGVELPDVIMRKHLAGEPGTEAYAIGVAGSGELPALPLTAMLSEDFAVKSWAEALADRDARLELHADEIRRLNGRVQEHAELQRQLLSAEQRLARMPALEREVEHATAERDAFAARVERAQVVDAAMRRSLSWRLTRPLRALKRLR